MGFVQFDQFSKIHHECKQHASSNTIKYRFHVPGNPVATKTTSAPSSCNDLTVESRKNNPEEYMSPSELVKIPAIPAIPAINSPSLTCNVPAQHDTVLHLDAQIFRQFHFPLDGFVGQAVPGDFRRRQPAHKIVFFFVHRYVVVPQSGQIRGGTDGGGATPDNGNFRMKIGRFDQVRVQRLGHVHFHERLRRKTLQPTNVDRTLFRRRDVATAGAQVGRGAHHPTGKTQRIVRQDLFGRAVVVLGANGRDERLDVNAGRATLLARGVGAFQTSIRFRNRRLFRQRGVFGVHEILQQGTLAHFPAPMFAARNRVHRGFDVRDRHLFDGGVQRCFFRRGTGGPTERDRGEAEADQVEGGIKKKMNIHKQAAGKIGACSGEETMNTPGVWDQVPREEGPPPSPGHPQGRWKSTN